MQTLDVAHIHAMQCDAEIDADTRRVYYTTIVWRYGTDNKQRALPVFNSEGQRIAR